jgi:hypothetical protein
MKNTKTAVIISIVIGVLVITGFALLLTRKQIVSENGEVKSSWRKTKPATTTTEEPTT